MRRACLLVGTILALSPLASPGLAEEVTAANIKNYPPHYIWGPVLKAPTDPKPLRWTKDTPVWIRGHSDQIGVIARIVGYAILQKLPEKNRDFAVMEEWGLAYGEPTRWHQGPTETDDIINIDVSDFYLENGSHDMVLMAVVTQGKNKRIFGRRDTLVRDGVFYNSPTTRDGKPNDPLLYESLMRDHMRELGEEIGDAIARESGVNSAMRSHGSTCAPRCALS